MFFKKEVCRIPKELALNLGLPHKIKCKGASKLQEQIDKIGNKNINLFEVMIKYSEFVSDVKILSKIPQEYQSRHIDFQKAAKYFIEGEQYLTSNKEKAKEKYLKGLMIYPYFSIARLNLGYLYRDSGKLEFSEKTYKEGIKYNPESPLLYTNLGRTLVELKKKDEAIEIFKQALNLLNGKDQFCMDQLEKLGALVRLYKDPNDPKSACLITIEEWEKFFKKNIKKAKTIEDFSAYLSLLIKDQRKNLFIDLWPKYKDKFIVMNKKHENWYLFESLSFRMLDNDTTALNVLLEGITEYSRSIPLHMNLSRIQVGEVKLTTLEKCFALGDFSTETLLIYYDEVKKKSGEDYANNRLLELYKKYNKFNAIYIYSIHKFRDTPQERCTFQLQYLEKLPEQEQLFWIGLIVGAYGEEKCYAQVIMLTQKYINNKCKDLGIYWNWALAKAHKGQAQEAKSVIQNLIKKDWLNAMQIENMQMLLNSKVFN